MKKNIIKGLGIFSICFILVTNLQYSLFNYGLSSNSLSQSIFAQTTTGGGTTGGGTTGGGTTAVSDPMPTECPPATITNLTSQKNNAKACYCTVKRKIVASGSSSGGSVSYETISFRGMENTCVSGKETDICSAFACSTRQIAGGGATTNP